MALRYGESAPVELTIWRMAEVFGWTLDYINSLPLAKLQEWAAFEDGKAKARKRGK